VSESKAGSGEAAGCHRSFSAARLSPSARQYASAGGEQSAKSGERARAIGGGTLSRPRPVQNASSDVALEDERDETEPTAAGTIQGIDVVHTLQQFGPRDARAQAETQSIGESAYTGIWCANKFFCFDSGGSQSHRGKRRLCHRGSGGR
jgi:hypothetical protein